jgi:hypothetical protein
MIKNDYHANSIYALRGALIVLLLAIAAAFQPADAQTKVVLGFTSAAGPSLAVFNSQLFMAYIGTDSNNTINVARSSNPLNGWNQVQPGGNRSFDTPAIAAFNGKLYLAWVGTVGSGSNINVMSSTDGVNFSGRYLVGNYTSAHGIALAANDGKLFLAWIGADAAHLTNFISSTDGVNWSNVTSAGNPGVASPWTPALGVFGNSVFLSWSRAALPEDPYRRIMQIFADAAGGSFGLSPPNPSTGVNAGPAMGSLGNTFYYAWVGPGLANELNLTTYQLQANNTLQVVTQAPLGNTEISSPAVAGFNGHAYVAFTGTNSNKNINILQVQ